MFISIDGCEGAGKTTQTKLLANYFDDNGHKVLVSKEPGNIKIKECRQIRQVLLNPSNKLCNRAELLLFLSDRAQNVQKFIKPALESGHYVICDRYIDSTIVYQLQTRGLDNEITRSMIDYASYGVIPDLTFILDLPAEIGLSRAKSSNKEFIGGDRIEREDMSFHKRLRSGFLSISKTHNRYVVIDATKTIEEISEEIKKTVRRII